LARANPARTVAVISTSQTPTGAMVANANLPFPPIGQVTSAISAQTRAAENVQIEAIDLAETYFGDHLAANMIVLGAAYQRGLLPIGAGMIERAITLNGTAVGMNTAAFRLGRQIVARPAWLAEQAAQAQGHQAVATAMPAALRAAIDAIATTGELRRLLDIRVPELVAYQNEAYAQTYLAFVARVRAAERASVPAQTRLSVAVARYLFKLMAYKDEYEVARLSLRPELAGELREQFGAGAQVAYQLHPPLLRALGWQKKVALGRWFDPVFRLLLALRAVRGTPLDLFGYAQLRRVERALITEYRELIERELAGLTPERYEHVVAVAELPDLIRGYEEVKRASIQRFREQVAALAEA
jgi:indolepyruvate ferredoxin oxidoreductase